MNPSKIVVTIGGSTVSPVENVIIQHSLNDIPSATIFGITAPVLEECKIMYDGQTVFSGLSGGSQADISGGHVSKVTTIHGGLFKLQQMSTTVPGLQYFGTYNTLSINQANMQFANSVLGKLLNELSGSSMLDIFKQILTSTFTYISQAMDDTISSVARNPMQEGTLEVFKKHLEQNSSVLDTELSRVQELGGLTPDIFETFAASHIYGIITQMVRSQGVTFFNLFQALCELYQISLGTSGNNIYAFPTAPIGKPSKILSENNIVSFSVGPFPLKLPTRCYITTTIPVDPAKEAISSTGSYPSFESAGQLTKLEQKLGTMRAIHYECPPYTTLRGSEPENTRSNLDDLAKGYLMKESFKYRQGQLTVPWGEQIAIGDIISVPTIYNRFPTFTGYVVGTILNVKSCTLTCNLQYVYTPDEAGTLGLFLFGSPSIYPGWSQNLIQSMRSPM